ncbi:MAG: hypothetical protein ABI266_03165 [Ginsengibacter sp.]
MSLSEQIFYLFVLAVPVACVAWTVTHEEVFREPREYCQKRSTNGKTLLERKIFYLFTCEYCFSHYVVVVFLFITKYQLLYPGWRGYLVAFFSLVWIANVYMSLFGFIRVGMKSERIEAKLKEVELKECEENLGDEKKKSGEK